MISNRCYVKSKFVEIQFLPIAYWNRDTLCGPAWWALYQPGPHVQARTYCFCFLVCVCLLGGGGGTYQEQTMFKSCLEYLFERETLIHSWRREQLFEVADRPKTRCGKCFLLVWCICWLDLLPNHDKTCQSSPPGASVGGTQLADCWKARYGCRFLLFHLLQNPPKSI